MTDDHSNWISKFDLERVCEHGYLLFLDLRKLPDNEVSKDLSRAGGISYYDPMAIQRMIDQGIITLRASDDIIWEYVGGYEHFLTKHGLKPKE